MVCGCSVRKRDLARHAKTKKHKSNKNKQGISEKELRRQARIKFKNGMKEAKLKSGYPSLEGSQTVDNTLPNYDKHSFKIDNTTSVGRKILNKIKNWLNKF